MPTDVDAGSRGATHPADDAVGALGGFACRPGRAVETAAGVLAVAALFAAAIRT